ncbi:hypothetical protein ACOSP7_003550 [Xanthoceras sorbifolium]
MEANGHQSRELLIDIYEENNLMDVLEPMPDCCIYRVPQHLRKINEEAYTPRIISIGPLHYGRKELMGMENQKRRYWSKFVGRLNAQQLEEFETYIRNEEQHIRDHYSVSSNLWNIEMIRYDVVFVIELFLRYYETGNLLLCTPHLINSLAIDLLLLENQLPYYVLDDLYTNACKACPSSEGFPSFFDLSLKFFSVMDIFKYDSNLGQPKVKHFTDLLRHALVKGAESTLNPDKNIFDLPSATKLNESGLIFRAVTDKGFLNISLEEIRYCGKWLPWFKVKEVRIPYIEIDDDTEILFRNVMALEQFHYPRETDVCNYVALMDYLINTANDVDLLAEKGIIVNGLGDNEAIAKMFNKLCSHISLSPSRYHGIVEKMIAHYNYPWNHWKATLISVYFSNLWSGTATIAATFLVILTLIQTVCSIMQVR